VTWVVLVASAVVAAVAVLGVMWPYQRTRRIALERMADPLEDERGALLRTLRDLDDEHREGALGDEDYRAQRLETERRAVAVLQALESRDGAEELASGLKDLRPAANGQAPGAARFPRRAVVGGLVGLALAAIIVPILAGAVRNRNAADPITGSIPGAIDDPTSLSFYEQRVREHPNDVAARLDLAARYQQSGNAQGAVEQYLEVLNLDPQNPEARANLGFVLYSAGRAEEGLASVRQALAIDPTYPDALYFEGIILLHGLGRPAEAAESFQAYLDAAPFGARRTEVQGLLEEARSGETPSSPSPTVSP
jgi:tetratricopeptide (TPR) repeat protein